MECRRPRKRQWPSRCLRIKPGIGSLEICREPRVQHAGPSWKKSRMHNCRAGVTRTASSLVLAVVSIGSVVILLGCSSKPSDPNTVTVAIESSPTNLDPRVGVDAQSERIDELMFDLFVKKDAHFNLQPDLATSWDTPNPLTYIFHLRTGVKFQNGQPFTARDVKWTLDSMLDHSILTSKYQAYRNVASIETPDPRTCCNHMKQPDAALCGACPMARLGLFPMEAGATFSSTQSALVRFAL